MGSDRLLKKTGRAAVTLFFFGVLMPSAHAIHKKGDEQVHGKIVAAEKRRVESPDYPVGGSNPSDAPLTSRYYEFEVSIRVACTTYVGTYQTPFNYLPLAFNPNQSIAFRLTKHVMYFDSPGVEDIRMHIRTSRKEC
jgi:hypothetical protein